MILRDIIHKPFRGHIAICSSARAWQSVTLIFLRASVHLFEAPFAGNFRLCDGEQRSARL
jgi:hypothetical protein